MVDSDCELEFLDEYTEIVQKCLRAEAAPVQDREVVPQVEEDLTLLLVERLPPKIKPKTRKHEDDSDYDPTKDNAFSSPSTSKSKKTKQSIDKKLQAYLKKIHRSTAGPNRKPKIFRGRPSTLSRKLLDIRIPNYDDPVCLPVRAIRDEALDLRRLNNWNNVCLEQIKRRDSLLKPETGESTSSTRTMVFRNIDNVETGQIDTAIWSKISVQNEEGDKKSEIFQCVLPRYKEKKELKDITFTSRKPKGMHPVTEEVILTKEPSKHGEVLIAYKSKEATSAVYKLVTEKTLDSIDEAEDYDEIKTYSKELLLVKMCAQCYQKSWRGTVSNAKKPVQCPICRGTLKNLPSFLAHVKSHSSAFVRMYKTAITSILADRVPYHYKCRICAKMFMSTKELRQHVFTHQCTRVFKCQVCNMTMRPKKPEALANRP